MRKLNKFILPLLIVVGTFAYLIAGYSQRPIDDTDIIQITDAEGQTHEKRWADVITYSESEIDNVIGDFVIGDSLYITGNMGIGGNIVDSVYIDEDLTVDGDLKVNGDFDFPTYYATYAFVDSSVTLTATQNDTIYITNADSTLFTITESSSITCQGDSIIIQNAGLYHMYISLSFQGNNNEVWKAGLTIDNEIEAAFNRYTSSNDTGNGSTSTCETLTVGQVIKPFIINTTDSDDPTVVSCSIVIVRVY